MAGYFLKDVQVNLDPNSFASAMGEAASVVLSVAAFPAGAVVEGAAAEGLAITASEIRAINKALGGTVEVTGTAESVIANMSYREGALAKAATVIRDIAGRHLFDDANKRTAQVVAEKILGSRANPAQIRAAIEQTATKTLRTVEEIAVALEK